VDDEKPPLDAALRHLAEQQRQSLTSHPTPQELAAYHAGELPPEAESRLLDHLAICRDCSDLLLDLAGFADLKPPEGMPELTDEQVEQDWQALRSRMRAGEGKKERTAEVVPIRPAGPVQRPERSYWLPIAASLLAVLGFSFGLYQTAQVGKLSKPSLSRIQYLDTERGEPGELRRISSQQAAEVVVPPVEEFPSYRVEIRQGDRVLWSETTPGPVDEISINIPLVFLKPGRYEIPLYGGTRGREEPVTTFDLQVE
jgi:hypothetical protein